MYKKYYVTHRNNKPLLAISTASSKSLPSFDVHHIALSISSALVPDFMLFSNVFFRTWSDAICRGSEWPVNISSAVRGGRFLCSVVRRTSSNSYASLGDTRVGWVGWNVSGVVVDRGDTSVDPAGVSELTALASLTALGWFPRLRKERIISVN